MRLPVETASVTPHGGFGTVRRSRSDGACGWRGIYPCTHQGVDLGGKAGTPVYAPERVKTILVAFDDKTAGLRGFGPGALKLLGASGAVHTLGHLDPAWWQETVWQIPSSPLEGLRGKPRLPKEGRVYAEGAQVGVMSNANHVHWQISIKGRTVDPMLWVTGQLGPESAMATGGGDEWILALLALLLVGGKRRRAS